MLTAGAHIGDRLSRSKLIATLALVLVSIVCVVPLAVPESVAATPLPGALSQLSSPFNCVSEAAVTPGCGTLLTSGINDAYEAQVSPDGRNVYSVAVGGSLVEYSRNLADGALTPIGCVTSGTESCAPANVNTNAIAMGSPAAIALSPDGRNAYVVTQANNSLVEFSRNLETGLLTETGCLSREDVECVAHEAKGLNSPYGVTVSPDGKNVYVASYADESIAEFSRNSETGELEQLPGVNNCITSASTGLTGCQTEKALGLERAIGVVVSPDGKDVYVAAGATNGEGAIVAFERAPSTGALTQLPGTAGCISETNRACTPGVGIDGPEDLVISPDGNNVYANSSVDNAVIELRRNATTGVLTQLPVPNACLTTEQTGAAASCGLAKAVERALGVAISPDGENVYVSSAVENAEAAFARSSTTGALTQLESPFECVTSDASGCAAGSNELIGLDGARRVTVSPDGTNVYLAGQNASSIVELARAVTPTILYLYPENGPEAGGTVVTIEGKGFIAGASVHFGANSASNVTVGSASSITATSPPGNGTVEVTVTTSSGISATTYGFSYTKSSSSGGGDGGASNVTENIPPLGKIASELGPVAMSVPPPVLAKTGNVAPVKGHVLVKLPGANAFVSLASLEQIPFGSVIEASDGTVSVTSANPNGTTQTGQFFGGQFVLTQGKNGQVVAKLSGGDFAVCPTARERAHIARAGSVRGRAAASGKHVVRKLWANAHGKFSTQGNYAAGAVQGTEWLTEDLCEGTLIKVTRDRVAVTNLVNHHHVEVKTGHHYLAKAP